MFIPIGDAPNDSRRTPWVNYLLIAVNVGVYLYAITTHRGDVAYSRWIQEWGYVPLAPRLDALFSHMFMHAGFLHLAGNMVFLYVFGDNVERRLGHVGYLLFYLACGFAAVLLFHLLSPASTVPMVGASGAIFGVEGFYFLAFPRNQVKVLVWVLLIFTWWIPARLVLGFSFVLNLISTFQTYGATGGGGVAYAAHVGGFVAGFSMAFVLAWGRGGRGRGAGMPAAVAGGGALAADLEAARALVDARRFAEAERVLEEALERTTLEEEGAELALRLGLLRARILGRPEAARQPLELAARLHPHPDARAVALAELQRIL